MNEYKNGSNIKLQEALAECTNSIEQGFNVAKRNNASLEQIINNAQRNINQLMSTMSKNSKIPNDCRELKQRLENTTDKLKNLHQEISSQLNHEKENLAAFTIVVYGKTMAGKSTFMEILTNGKGETIGKGTQRTTLDVRGYTWNGLKIYDTPGIAASAAGGREDEKKAYKIAKQADLIVFLLGDDNISQEEAKAFVDLKGMGKPMLVLFNIKYNLNIDKSPKYRISKMCKQMDEYRIEEMKAQFLEMVSAKDNVYTDVDFVSAHLQAAYLLKSNDKSIKEFDKNELYNLSNFGQVEDIIVNTVSDKGPFLQYKVFADLAYKQTENIINDLRTQWETSDELWEIYDKHLEKFNELSDKLIDKINKDVKNFVAHIKGDLEDEKDSFADTWYDSEGAGYAWERTIEKQKIDDKAKRFLEGLRDECYDMLCDFQETFNKEIKFKMNNMDIEGISGEDIIDFKFGLNMAIGVGGIAAVLAGSSLLGPVGWAIAGASLLVNWLFDDKEEKIREAKRKMRGQLQDSIDEIGVEINNKLIEVCQETFISGMFDSIQTQIIDSMNSIYEFRDSQNYLIENLERLMNDINMQLLAVAVSNTSISPQIMDHINHIDREIGKNFVIYFKDLEMDFDNNCAIFYKDAFGFRVYGEHLEEIESLLQEKVFVL